MGWAGVATRRVGILNSSQINKNVKPIHARVAVKLLINITDQAHKSLKEWFNTKDLSSLQEQKMIYLQ